MVLGKELRESFPLVVFHALSVVLILGVVLFFYYQMANKLSINRQKASLSAFLSLVESKIYAAFPEEESFVVPRSFVYQTALYDQEGKMIFSLMDQTPPPLLMDGFVMDGDRLCLSRYLGDNALGIGALSVSKPIEREQVWKQVAWLIALVVCYLILSTFWLFNRSREPLLEANRRLKLFMDDAMHELRAPLGVMRLNAEMLQEGSNEAQFQTRIGRILGAGAALETLYGSLEYGMKRGKVNYVVKKLDLSQLLESQLLFFAEMVEIRHLNLQQAVTPGILVEMSEEEAIRLIDNNLSNAIKYSHEDGRLTVTLERLDNEVHLSFQDEGEGIEDVSKIFERFRRENHTQGGLGLGLGIVKEICDKYSIVIEIDSQKGKGSRFLYRFDNISSS